MANLKKHFVFKVGGGSSAAGTSSSGGSHGASPSTELLPPGFSKSAFMNEVSSLLDQCGLYVSAMNGFCTSGCSLAKCLVRVFHAVPLYRETASTLLSNWEEIAQTTAAASASVKTETLMQLQDVLTRLETSGENKEDELAESVHAVSSCLMAYIELQAQFSYSVFKALGKLSRQQQNGFLKTQSRAEDAVRKQFSQIINRLTGPSVKTPSSPPISQATTPQQTQSSGAVWPAEIHLAPSSGELLVSAAQPDSATATCMTDIPDSGLDDVINLLSIGAVSPPTSSAPSASSASSSSAVAAAAAPPKIPPRPDAFSQDAFRLKQRQQRQQLDSSESGAGAQAGADADEKKLETPSWSPWGPDWSTEDLSNWPSHSSDASDYDPGWMRWQSSSAKEKTQTWPRPLRDPSAPWEWRDDETEDTLDTWKAGNREGDRVAKTCTWPLKVATESSWHESDPWRKEDPSPTTSQTTSWKGDDDYQGFHLFNQR